MADPINTNQGAQGAGQTIGVTDARGARRVGLIWMLVISTALAVIAVLGVWALNIQRLNSLGQPHVAAHAGKVPPSAP